MDRRALDGRRRGFRLEVPLKRGRWRTKLGVLLMPLALSGCLLLVEGGAIEELSTDAPPTGAVESPVRVFLADGSVVVYPDGLEFRGGAIRGEGRRLDLLSVDETPVTATALEDVVGMEMFREWIEPTQSVVWSVAATAVLGGGLGLLASGDFLGSQTAQSSPGLF